MEKEKTTYKTVQQAAAFLNVNAGTIRRWAQSGELKGVKLGSRGDWRFTEEELAKMIKVEKRKFERIKAFLEEHANEIQRIAQEKHLQYLGTKNVRQKNLRKTRITHVIVVKELSNNLSNMKKGTVVFERLGEQLAKEAVADEMTLEEAVDGTIFLKQAFWEKLDQEGLLHNLTIRDFYSFSHIITTYCDIIASKIAFAYHDFYKNSEEQHRYQARLLENVSDAIISTDMHSVIQTWNKAAEQMYGYKIEEVIGKKLDKVTRTKFITYSLSSIKTSLRKRGVWKGDVIHIKKDGTPMHILSSSSMIRNSSGKAIGVVGVNKDISKLKQIEQKLQEIGDFNKRLLESINDVFIAYDKNLNFTFINQRAEEMIGIKRDVVLGKNAFKLYPNYKKTAMYSNYRKALKTRKPVTFEYFGPKTKRWYNVRAYPSLNGLSVYFTDITERKQIEETLQYYASIAQSISDAVIATDLQYRIISWNKAAEELYGWKQKDVLGSLAKDIIPTEFVNPAGKNWEADLFTNGLWKGEVIQKHRDGKMINILSSVSRVKDLHGKIIGAVAVNKDITERIELERRKDDFIALASHELKTPVTSLKMYTQIIERRLKKTKEIEAQRFTTRMNEQLDKLTNLVQDLLDVSRIQSGKLEYRKEPFRLDKLIKECVDDIQPISTSHKIVIKKMTSAEVFGDLDRIRQVITNLLTNAVKYSPDAKDVIVSSRRNNDSVTVSVRDFGIGIPKSQYTKIFNRFYQVNSPKGKAFPGLGLGLFISNEIIQRHKGALWVESIEGKGSIFSFTLPMKDMSSKPDDR